MTDQSEPQGVFYTADLPLSWTALSRLSSVQVEQWQHDAVALLRALAVIEAPIGEAERDTASAAGKSMERLEAKLDLALNMIMQLARQQASYLYRILSSCAQIPWNGLMQPSRKQAS